MHVRNLLVQVFRVFEAIAQVCHDKITVVPCGIVAQVLEEELGGERDLLLRVEAEVLDDPVAAKKELI